jgi:hypothetical protein
LRYQDLQHAWLHPQEFHAERESGSNNR